jgi:hypothetical protein
LESPIPLEAAAPSLPSFAHELETTPEPVQLGHVEKAPGFEATAADPIHAHVETSPDLEIPSILDRTSVAPDPNFMSDRSQMVEEFATKFSAAGPEVAVGVAGAEIVEHAGPVPVRHDEETARITPWVSEPAPAAEHAAQEHHVVDFTPPPSPGLHLGLEEFAAEIATAPVAAPEPEHVVEVAPPPAEVVEVAEPAPSMAAELEQAIITADAQEEPAPAPEAAAAPATLEASLEQSLEPEASVAAIIEPPEPAVEEPKKAADLEFAQALEAAISDAPEAPPEPEHAAAAAAAAGTSTSIEAAVAAEETGKFAAMPELDGVDPKIIATAIERVLANAKSQIMEEVLKELKK